MNGDQRPTPSSSGPAEWILPAPDPVWEEQKARLWAMTRDERVRAMRAGKLSLRLCLHWASQRPAEVPLAADGEFEFIAISTPEVADADNTPSQRERVIESPIGRPVREARSGRGD
jgi:hypothetical protein